MADYLLPDVGEGLTEAEIVSWRVKEGDVIEINDIVVEIETAKSLVELPSPYAGRVIGAAGGRGRDRSRSAPRSSRSATRPRPPRRPPPAAPAPATCEIDLSNPAASGGGEGESLVGRNKADRGPVRRPRKGTASPSTDAGAAAQMQVQGAFAPGGAQSQPVVEADEPAVPAETAPVQEAASEFVPTRALTGERVRVLAKPPVRKLAKDLGVDLTSLTPSGAGGTVTREDVQSAAAGSVSAPRCGRRTTRSPGRPQRRTSGAAPSASAASRSRASAR